MLTEDQISDLYESRAARKKPAQGKGKVWVRDASNTLVTETVTRMGDYNWGTHVGKVGTMRRSRKGASRRMPNGSRKYQAMNYDPQTPEVIAYKLKPR